MSDPDFSDVIDAIYSAALDPERWSHAIERTAAHVGGSGGILMLNDLEKNSGRIVNGGLREDLGALYVERHVRNPVSERMMSQPTGRPLSARSLVGDREVILKSEVYADIWAPQKQVDLLCLPCDHFSGRGTTGGVAVGVSSRQAANIDVMLQRLERLAPHLARALDLFRELSAWRNERHGLAALIQSMNGAVLLLDRHGRLIQANRDADEALREENALRLGPDGRIAPGRASCLSAGALDRFISEALKANGGETFRQRLLIHCRERQPPFLLLATPLPRGMVDFWELAGRDAQLLLQLVDPLAQPTADQQLLQDLFGLTASEAKVAAMVAEGLSTPEIARKLGIKATTVRTHLARSFEKLGVNSQVKLSRLLSRLEVRKLA